MAHESTSAIQLSVASELALFATMKSLLGNHPVPIGLGLLMGVTAWIVVTLRAIYVPPVCDEVTSFIYFIRPGSFQPFYAILDANNHVVNSAISKFFTLLFGDSLFSLRLGNILSFGIYLLYIFKFVRFFRSKLTWLAWVTCLVTPIYLITFFSLSRGYGLSLAFFIAALFHLTRYVNRSNLKDHLLTLVFSGLALWANLSLMVPVLLFGLLSTLLVSARFLELNIVQRIISASISVGWIIQSFYALKYSMVLKENGALYYGAVEDFWNNSLVGSLIYIIDGFKTAEVALVLLLVVSVTLLCLRLSKRVLPNQLVLITAVTIATIIAIPVMHYVLEVRYPIDRSTVHLVILIFSTFFFSIDSIKSEKVLVLVASPLLFLIVGNALKQFNLTNTPIWKQFNTPKHFYEKLIAHCDSTGEAPTLEANGLNVLVLDYYSFLNSSGLGLVSDPSTGSSLVDFKIKKQHEITISDTAQYDIQFKDTETGVHLLSRKEPVPWRHEQSWVLSDVQSSLTYINLAKGNIDSCTNTPIKLTVHFDAFTENSFTDWELVYYISSESESSTNYVKLYRSAYHTHQGSIKSAIVLENPPKNASEINVYLWNRKNIPISITKSETSLSRVTESTALNQQI